MSHLPPPYFYFFIKRLVVPSAGSIRHCTFLSLAFICFFDADRDPTRRKHRFQVNQQLKSRAKIKEGFGFLAQERFFTSTSSARQSMCSETLTSTCWREHSENSEAEVRREAGLVLPSPYHPHWGRGAKRRMEGVWRVQYP